jgi:hypothetical protein
MVCSASLAPLIRRQQLVVNPEHPNYPVALAK